MKNCLLLLPVVCFALFSCHKNSGSGGGSKGPLLTRYVLNRGDSVVYEMQYTSGLVTQFTFTGNGFGPNLDIQTTQLFRDRNGKITEIIDAVPDADSALNPPDTTIVYQDKSNAHYAYMVSTHYRDPYRQPIDIRDSTVFAYNSAGQIGLAQFYIRDASVSPVYELRGARYFSYDGRGNLATDSSVALDGQDPQYSSPQVAYHYTYDDHPNPCPMGADALLIPDRDWIGMPHINAWCSKNNVISAQTNWVQQPSSNYSMQRTFAYSSSGLPTGGTEEWTQLIYPQHSENVTRYYY